MPLSSSASSFFDRLFLTPGYPVSSSSLPLRRVLFWPAILTPGYPVSGASLPLRLTLFWPVILTPGYPVLVPLSRSAASYSDRLFWRPAIRFPVPLSRSAASPSDRLFYRPDIRFSVPHLPLRLVLFWPAIWRPGLPFPVPQGLLFTPRFGILGRLFRRPPFFHHPTFPSRLFGWPARSLCRLTVGLLFLPLRGFYRPAVFTAPRFLPLRGFYRSAFTGSLGGFALPPPSSLLPPRLPPLPGGSLFGPPYGTPAVLPLRGFYRSAVFTAPRFLPLRDFYRSAVFTAPTLPFCPPVFALFRAHPVLPAPP